jgi:hypothetical protein
MFRRLALASFLALVLLSSTAWAAPEDEEAGADALLQAFPLDPTGERVARTTRSEVPRRSEAVRALPESTGGVEGSAAKPLVLVTAGAAALLLVAGGIGSLRRRSSLSRRRSSTPLSQMGWQGTRERIIEYRVPLPEGASDIEPMAIAGQRHYPDIAGRARVRSLELPSGADRPAPPPPPVEWRSVA